MIFCEGWDFGKSSKKAKFLESERCGAGFTQLSRRVGGLKEGVQCF